MTRATFAERFASLRAERGPFCLGLDPTPELLKAWGLPEDVWGLKAFCDKVIDAAEMDLSVIKPQSAYFERFGAAGMEVLGEIIGSIRAMGSLSLLDVKRGDIGSTNRGYALGLLGPDSAMGADAITVTAYLGFDALGPIMERATETNSGVFVIVLSSNPEGRWLQNAQVSQGVTVVQHLSAAITDKNRALCPEGTGPIGAVVGVTAPEASDTVARLERSLILAPGLGAQGGDFAMLADRFAAARQRVIPSSSRAILSRGPDLKRLRNSIREHNAQARDALG